MNWQGTLLWGFTGTVLLTTITRASQAFGLTRIDFPFILGTIFTPNRDRAKVIGFLVHLVNGWVFAFLYATYFQSIGRATWWIGGILGLAHGVFTLVVLMPVIAAAHPRMATESWGPTPTRQLEPPGFLALHYGRRTPIVTLVAHVLYGIVLGAFYTSV